MTVKVGINGFGRIGRQVLKAIRDMYPNELEVVAFNDIGDMKTMAHLLKYDSTYGRFNGTVEVAEDGLVIDGKKVKVFKETDPAAIPWKDLGIDIVIESTGLFTLKEDGVNKKGKQVKGAVNHITSGGAKKVIISAPATGEDLTVVLGVNEDQYDAAKHHVVSNASCTTNCLAPAAKVVHDNLTIKRAFMTTIHSYTNDQKVLDLPHSDLRRARAAGLNIIPTTTGAAKAIALAAPVVVGMMFKPPPSPLLTSPLKLRKRPLRKNCARCSVMLPRLPASRAFLKPWTNLSSAWTSKAAPIVPRLICPSRLFWARKRTTSSKLLPGTTMNGVTPAAPPISRR